MDDHRIVLLSRDADRAYDKRMQNPLAMRGLAFVEFANRDQDHLGSIFSALGLSRHKRLKGGGPAVYQSGSIAFVANGATRGHAADFAAAHGPSVSALGLSFDNPAKAFESAVQRGARPADIERTLDAPAVYGVGDSLVYFVGKDGLAPALEAHRSPLTAVDKGFDAVDHLTNNVEQGALARWSAFYKDVFGFTEVRSFDIKGAKTGLYSYALRSPCGTFSIPINEDKGSTGQIAEYLREYRGAGVQHIALRTTDILSALDRMGGALPTLDMDDDYYVEAFARVPNVRQDKRTIMQHQVLLDGDAEGYLLQIFTQNLLGPVFFEFIQRENHLSFGEGNFSALFRSIERDQEKRGVL
jgi:4-hydroxyphenylpyruvate dioxygenase